ncbi:MAG: hypothetical protein II685_06755, partial [Clostridia bacterium]|nr:hypothetical protein [Clostridia bacterium]
TVYTYALNDDITEITEENIDDFKPLTITDGYANFCPVFTDFTEARSVGMPFRGLYEISARLLTKYNITHFIINPSSLGFIMNKSILGLVEAPIVEEITAAAEPTEKTVDNKAADTDAAAESVEINTAAQNAEEIISEQEAPLVQDQFITEEDTQSFNAFENAAVSDPVDGFMEEVQNEIAQEPQQFVPDMNVPSDETVFAQNSQVADQFLTPAQTSAQAADQFLTSTQTSTPVADQFFAQPKAPIAEQFAAAPSLTQAPVADQFFAQPKTAAAPIAQPAPQPVLEKPAEPTPEPEQAAAPKAPKEKSNQDIVIKANNPDGTKKAIKVSMPIFIPDDPNEDLEVNTSVSSSLQNAIKKSQAMMNDDVFGKKPFNEALGKPVEEKPADNAPKKDFSFSDIMNDLASDNESTKFDLSSLMMSHAEEQPAAPVKPKLTIQTQATETKMIARELEVEPDIRVVQILRDKLNDGYRTLARLISEAEVMYAEYDANTKHILIDGNNKGHIFSEKIYADKSVENFAKNGIKVYIKEYKNEDLFSMLYEYKRHGIQDLVLDETANWVIVSADTIIDMLDVNEKKFVPIPIANPELMFAMTTLFQKLQSKNDNPKRKQEIASLEKMMIREFTSARYILPLVAYDENNIRPISIDGKNGVKRILVFSDAFEMKRFFGDKIGIVRDYEIITYKELIKKFTVMPNTVVVLNEGPLRFEFNDHNCDHINKVIMGK